METSTPSVSFPTDAMPPERSYNSLEALRIDINAWAAPRGYAFSVLRSRTYNGRKDIVFTCDRGRRPASEGSGMQERARRCIGCPFSLNAKEDARGSFFVKHRPNQKYHKHNHLPSFSAVAHPAHRRISREDEIQIRNMSRAGIQPKNIRYYLHTTTQPLLIQHDVWNAVAKGKRDLAKGQSNIAALASELNTQGFWNKICTDADGRVTAVIFIYRKSLDYVKSYPEVMLLDYTYKTNKYKMPLLDIVGVDALKRTFCIAFAFLNGEDEDDFGWALSRLRGIYDANGITSPGVILTDRCLACINALGFNDCFPGSYVMLCNWHITNAVTVNCKPSFFRDNGDSGNAERWKEFLDFWNDIVRSPTQDIYEERLKKFKVKYVSTHLDEVGYCIDNWLTLYKERFVKAWIDQYPHFDIKVTSRAEGIHRLIKSHMNHSLIDLFENYKIIKQVLVNQYAELEAAQSRQSASNPSIRASRVIFGTIRGWVSHEALLLIEKQLERLKGQEELPPCTGAFTRTMCLPCAHTIQPYLQEKLHIELSQIHSHWHLRRPGQPTVIIEPRYRFDSADVKSSLPPSSTQREPLLVEAVNESLQPKVKRPPKCSACGVIGHTMKSKSCLLRLEKYRKELEEMDAADAANEAALRLLKTPSPQPAPEPQPLPYGDPQAIYLQYQHNRNEWYSTLPQGVRGTDERYRRATGLPLVYEEARYKQALGWREMGRYCVGRGTRRPWTTEEMNAWIDNEKEEEQRDNEQGDEDFYRDQRNPTHQVHLRRRQGRIYEDQQNRQRLYEQRLNPQR
ncbi:hypothetical protein FANTH_13693 [Fusarium anthophilum]|uniref:MULE transposase domain-containing protein n=1 Tax=Fusarium anthophilum TaxID=48485 RepID=A0A8H4YMU0_9HYPO|nr:hypothetical protein FANTH_13693 [Fusarium anthophilum]